MTNSLNFDIIKTIHSMHTRTHACIINQFKYMHTHMHACIINELHSPVLLPVTSDSPLVLVPLAPVLLVLTIVLTYLPLCRSRSTVVSWCMRVVKPDKRAMSRPARTSRPMASDIRTNIRPLL